MRRVKEVTDKQLIFLNKVLFVTVIIVTCLTLSTQPWKTWQPTTTGGQIVSSLETHPVSKYTVALLTGVETKQTYSTRMMCSGTLISPTVVLTARHCLKTPNITYALVVIGAHSTPEGTPDEINRCRTTPNAWAMLTGEDPQDDYALVSLKGCPGVLPGYIPPSSLSPNLHQSTLTLAHPSDKKTVAYLPSLWALERNVEAKGSYLPRANLPNGTWLETSGQTAPGASGSGLLVNTEGQWSVAGVLVSVRSAQTLPWPLTSPGRSRYILLNEEVQQQLQVWITDFNEKPAAAVSGYSPQLMKLLKTQNLKNHPKYQKTVTESLKNSLYNQP